MTEAAPTRTARPETAETAPDPAWIEALSGWHASRDRAQRLNRNLLQYAAAFAAILGIEAGAEGMFRVAQGLRTAQTASPSTEVELVLRLGLTLSIVLAGLLLLTFIRRALAERAAEEYRAVLIRKRPELFPIRGDGE